MSRKVEVVLVGNARQLQKTLGQAEQSLGRFGKSASRHYSGLARSAGFAAGAIGTYGLAEAIGSSLKAAEQMSVTHRQLNQQIRVTDTSTKAAAGPVAALDARFTRFGYTNMQTQQALAYTVRATGNVQSGMNLMGDAANLAKGRHIALSKAALVLGNVWDGNTSALKRLGIQIPKNISPMAALALVHQRFAGQAQAGTSVMDRLHATLGNLEETVGAQLLPTVNRLIERFGVWMDKGGGAKKITDAVRASVAFLTSAVRTVAPWIERIARFANASAHAIGGWKRAIELLLALKFAFTLNSWANSLSTFTTRTTRAKGQVNLLGKALSSLPGRVFVSVVIAEQIIKHFIPGHSHMGGDFSDPTAHDAYVTVGGKQYVRGTSSAATAIEAAKLRKAFAHFGAGTAAAHPASTPTLPAATLPSDIPSGGVKKGRKPSTHAGSVAAGSNIFSAGFQLAMLRAQERIARTHGGPASERGLLALDRRGLHMLDSLRPATLAFRGLSDAAMKHLSVEDKRMRVQRALLDIEREKLSLDKQAADASKKLGLGGLGKVAIHSSSLLAGLAIPYAQKVALEQRLSQAMAHKFMVPVGPVSNGIPTRAGHTIVIEHVVVNGSDGKRIWREIQQEANRHAGRNSGGRNRGRNAGSSLFTG